MLQCNKNQMAHRELHIDPGGTSSERVIFWEFRLMDHVELDGWH